MTPHPYARDPHSGAGNCWCGWPEIWGEHPPPIHGGPPIQPQPPKPRGLDRVRAAVRAARGDDACPTAPIRWSALEVNS